MGTTQIQNLGNDLNLINVDLPKNTQNDGEFAKTFENASSENNIENLAKRNVDVVEELRPAENVKEDYLKETNGRKFDNKVESPGNKNVNENKEVTSLDKASKEVINLDEDEKEAIDNAINNILSAYSELFGVSIDELKSFMQENGISVSDILDPSKVQSIVMQFNGITDSIDILTLDSIYDSIKDLEKVVNDNLKTLSDEFGIGTDELKISIEDVEFLKPSDGVSVNDRNIGNTDNKNEFVSNDANDTDDIKAGNDLNDTLSVNKNESNSDNAKGNEFGNGNFTNNTNAQIQSENVTVTESNVPIADNAQEIYDQIGEYVRNLSTENINEVELKLNPETLGTIHVRVSQSEGVMKAELVTNNENVRAILEGQLIQLKEDFDRSGIRVDEVEVRVSTNEFNENAEQESRDEANERAAQNAPSRRIDILNGIDLEEVEEYEDDEKIAVEMMAANGNSMDYRA